MVSASLFGTGALGWAYTCDVPKFIAYLEIAQDFHRYPVKNQIIAEKIIFHIFLYRIAPSGNNAVSIQGVS